MSITKLFLAGNNSIQGEFGSDIPVGDGEIDNFFYSVAAAYSMPTFKAIYC
jgi:hypothetical protein